LNSTNKPIALSAVLITLNAAKQLRSTLESVQFCDDVVVVDSHSSDDTCQIATEMGARVITQQWLGFGMQKQFAVAQARHEWVLCIDADERVSPALEQHIRAVLQQAESGYLHDDVAGFDMPRCNFFLGRYLRHGEGYPDYSRRLFDRRKAGWSNDPVHEKVEALAANGQFERLQGDLIHDSAESLSNYLHKQNRYTSIQAEQLAARGKWPSTGKMVFSPLIRFVKFFLVRKGFLDGWAGLVHIAIGCFNSFMKYAKTRELILQQGNSKKKP